MYIQAIEDKIVAEILPEAPTTEVKTPGGLIVPESTQDKVADYARVISVGDKVTNIKPGDIIVAIKQKGAFVDIQNTGTLKIIKAYFISEIVGVMREVNINA